MRMHACIHACMSATKGDDGEGCYDVKLAVYILLCDFHSTTGVDELFTYDTCCACCVHMD